MHSLAVALSKIDHCASRDTSGAFKKQSLPSGGGREGVSWFVSHEDIVPHSQPFNRAESASGRLRFHPANIHVHLMMLHHFIPHELWIRWVKKKIAGEAEEEGNWDRGWSHQRIIVAILVFSPRLEKRVNAADGLDLGISTATLWGFFTPSPVPTSLKAINPHVTFLCDAKIMLAG